MIYEVSQMPPGERVDLKVAEVAPPVVESEHALHAPMPVAAAPAERPAPIVRYASDLEREASELISSMASPQLALSILRAMKRAQDAPQSVIFRTSVGGIRCRALWLWQSGDLLLSAFATESMAMEPALGVPMRMSAGRFGEGDYICVASHSDPVVGVDLLAFIRYSHAVDKNGALKDDAPSVVSARESDTISEDGDPIVAGEQAASLDLRSRTVPREADFDRPRQ